LKRTVIVIPAVLELLEENQRASGPVPELVLRQVAGNGVNPGRELLGGIEAMKMAGDPYESFLNQVLGPISVAGFPNDEVNQPIPISVIKVLEGSGAAIEMSGHKFLVGQLDQGAEVPQLLLLHHHLDGH